MGSLNRTKALSVDGTSLTRTNSFLMLSSSTAVRVTTPVLSVSPAAIIRTGSALSSAASESSLRVTVTLAGIGPCSERMVIVLTSPSAIVAGVALREPRTRSSSSSMVSV